MERVWIAKWDHVEQPLRGDLSPLQRDLRIDQFRKEHGLGKPNELILRMLPDPARAGAYGASPTQS
jgi:hypothetical protein